MKKICLTVAIIALTLLLTGCVYDVPEGCTPEHHSYEDALNHARSIDSAATVDANHVDLVDEYGYQYREWPAVINGLDCHVCSAHHPVYDRTGEFRRFYYSMRTDHDYQLMNLLLQDGYEGWEQREGVLHRYHTSGDLYVYLPALADEPLSDEALRVLWERAETLQATYAQRAIQKPVIFCVPAPRRFSETSVGMTHLYFEAYTEEAWADYLAEYRERWQLKAQ